MSVHRQHTVELTRYLHTNGMGLGACVRWGGSRTCCCHGMVSAGARSGMCRVVVGVAQRRKREVLGGQRQWGVGR